MVPSEPSEIGVLDINMTAAAKTGRIVRRLIRNRVKAVQWHSYEVKGLESNPEVTLLGESSPTTKYQIFKYPR